MVASSSAFFLPLSPPAKGSSIDSDWSTRNRKQPGFLRLISAWYAMVVLHFWHHVRSFRGPSIRLVHSLLLQNSGPVGQIAGATGPKDSSESESVQLSYPPR